jgi:hypothetical protein
MPYVCTAQHHFGGHGSEPSIQIVIPASHLRARSRCSFVISQSALEAYRPTATPDYGDDLPLETRDVLRKARGHVPGR